MPWCPKCITEYQKGFESCADCGTPQIPDPDMPVQQIDPRAPISASSGIGAGCLGAIFGWTALVVLGGLAACILPANQSGNFSAIRLCILPVVYGVAGFVAGTSVRARFLSSLIGWLIASFPLLSVMGLAFAHDEAPLPIAQANLLWCAVFSQLVVGPLAAVAGTRFAKAPNWGNLTLCLVPMGATILALLLASCIVAGSK